jgi:acyl carrier protein
VFLEDVIEVVRSLAPIPEAAITADSDLVADLGFDSFKSVELAAALEDRFDFTFDEDSLDFDQFTTPSCVATLVEQALKRSGARG